MHIARKLAAFVLAGGTALAGAIPAQAAPLFQMKPAEINTSSDVVNVRHRSRRNLRFNQRRGLLNGHRGSRHHRRGWRQYNGWWFPPAAFALGVIIGNQNRYVQPRVRYRSTLPRAHYDWCDWRYQTYRHWDNTYVPRIGYRAQCRSPYWPGY